MLRARIQRIETTTVDVEGSDLPALHAKLNAARPEGFDLVSAPVSMQAGGGQITATGTYHRVDTVEEITGETRAELDAAVPEGWRILHYLRD